MKLSNEMKIGEKELRSALKVRLISGLRGGDKIIEEMGIENGAARIDLAVITDRICGYEIKSDYDNALRLANQIHSYNRVFEHIYIVTGPSSSLLIEGILPSWWGILRAMRATDGQILLNEVRPSAKNAKRDIYSLLTLFKRDELNDLAAKYSVAAKVIRGPKNGLIDCLANLLSLDDINHEATTALKSRAMPLVVVQ